MLNGKPLLIWTYDVARHYGKVYRGEPVDIAVSSDSDAILELVPSKCRYKRPDELAQDDTPKMEAIRHVVQEAESRNKCKYIYVIDLDICNPMRTVHDVQACMMYAQQEGVKTVVSVTKARRNPYFNQVIRLMNGGCRKTISGNAVYTRQSARPVYDLNNCIYVYDRDWLVADTTNDPITDNTGVYVMSEWEAFDIDTELDLSIVEFLMGQYGER